MVYRLANATRTAKTNASTALLNNGSIQFRTGAQPTNVDDSAQGTLLATVTFAATAAPSATNGVWNW